MDNKIVLYGASGHGKVIIDILQMNNQEIECIIDDNPKTINILDLEIIKTTDFKLVKNQKVILSIGNNKIRKILAEKLDVNFVNAIHPKSIISKYTSVASGTVIMAGVIINADTKIGEHCIINTGAVIDHDCKISNFVHISPNASLAGGVEVGEGTQVGIGASVIQGIKIGKWVTIGAGSVVIKDIPDFAVVVGNPGRIIKFH